MKNLGFRERMILLGAAVTVVIAAWFILFYRPIQSRTSRLNKEIEQYNARIENAESFNNQIKELTQEIEELKKEDKENKSKILSKQRITLISDEIGKQARKYNIDIRAIIPEKEALFSDTTGTGMISRMPVKLFARGTFFDFGQFLESFKDFPFMIKAGPLSLSTDDDLYPKLIIELTVYVYFYKE